MEEEEEVEMKLDEIELGLGGIGKNQDTVIQRILKNSTEAIIPKCSIWLRKCCMRFEKGPVRGASGGGGYEAHKNVEWSVIRSSGGGGNKAHANVQAGMYG